MSFHAFPCFSIGMWITNRYMYPQTRSITPIDPPCYDPPCHDLPKVMILQFTMWNYQRYIPGRISRKNPIQSHYCTIIPIKSRYFPLNPYSIATMPLVSHGHAGPCSCVGRLTLQISIARRKDQDVTARSDRLQHVHQGFSWKLRQGR